MPAGIFSFKKPRSSGRTRQVSRIHFDGRSSPCLHAHGNEQRHNGFGYRVSPAGATGHLATHPSDPGPWHTCRLPSCSRPSLQCPASAQNKKACTRQASEIRAATPAGTAQRRGSACRPEKSFFGVGWGPGGRKGQFLQKTPLPSPSQDPDKNHASTGRRASMAALSKTRWLELPRKSSSRSRRAST